MSHSRIRLVSPVKSRLSPASLMLETSFLGARPPPTCAPRLRIFFSRRYSFSFISGLAVTGSDTATKGSGSEMDTIIREFASSLLIGPYTLLELKYRMFDDGSHALEVVEVPDLDGGVEGRAHECRVGERLQSYHARGVAMQNLRALYA